MITYFEDKEDINHIGGLLNIASWITAAARHKLVSAMNDV